MWLFEKSLKLPNNQAKAIHFHNFDFSSFRQKACTAKRVKVFTVYAHQTFWMMFSLSDSMFSNPVFEIIFVKITCAACAVNKHIFAEIAFREPFELKKYQQDSAKAAT